MYRIIALIITLLISFNSLAVEASQQFTLKEAILIALRFNPTIRNAELQRVIDKFGLKVVKNNYELHYALTGTAQYLSTRNNGVDNLSKNIVVNPSSSILLPSGGTASLNWSNPVRESYYNPGLSFSLKQPLLRGAGSAVTLAPLANAYDQEKINRLILKNTLITTITAIINDYLQILRDQNSLLTQQLALQNSQKEYAQNKIKIRVGRMAAADNIPQEALIANQKLNLIYAQNALKFDKTQLLNDMGLDPKTDFTVTKEIVLPDESIPALNDAKKTIEKNNIDYQVALINQKIQHRKLKVAKDNLRWKLDLTATVATGNGQGSSPNSGIPSLYNNQNGSQALQLDLAIPIDDKQLEQNVVNEKITLEQLKISLQQKRFQLENNVINALENINTQKQQIEQAITARNLAKNSLDIALKKLEFGLVSTFETTILRTNLINAELQVINSKMNYLNAIVNLHQLLGITLDVWDVKIKN